MPYFRYFITRLPANIYFFSFLLLFLSLAFAVVLNFEFSTLPKLLYDKYFINSAVFSLKNSLTALVITTLIGGLSSVLLDFTNSYLKKLCLILAGICVVLPSVTVIFGWQIFFNAQNFIYLFLKNSLNFDLALGQPAIIFIYIYYNLPLAIIFLLPRISQTSSAYSNLSKYLGFGFTDKIAYLYWPAIKGSMSGLFFIIFLFCFQDFSVAYILGGKPQETALSVFIYEKLIYKGDIKVASQIAFIQIIPNLMYLIFLCFNSNHLKYSLNSVKTLQRNKKATFITGNIAALGLIIFMLTPLIAIIIKAFLTILEGGWQMLGLITNNQTFREALVNSIKISLTAAALSCLMAYFHLSILAKYRKRYLEHLPLVIMVIPPLITALSFFILLKTIKSLNLVDYWPLIAMLNAVSYFPTLVYFWKEPFLTVHNNHRHLLSYLGVGVFKKFYLVDMRLLGEIFLIGFSIMAALALGDLTFIMFFGTPFETLTTLHNNLRNLYQFNLAILLQIIFILIIALFFIPNLVSQITKQHNPKNN